ncbi:6-phosphogluconolactonase [Xanthomarina sp.]|uniref:6-phosphogluconolactonase n=1 Tax=Xanthomarina sp. TaxID=1931211 RepID=UPI002BD2808B|nr:6-phosphogluconolactonase [Xanthomarina sp.]HLV40131.1 6-phosphogluconolactonase [Xanthomarina sp.]
MILKIYKEIDELIIVLTEAIRKVAEEAIEARGQFNFVLSGGSSPLKLYKLLASETYRNKIDWNKTYFFFGDERFVPENDSQRNSLMAKEVLFDSLKIADSHIFKVDTTGSSAEAAQRYANSITAHFYNKPIEFDFILLGLGDDAHTASLFPDTEVLKESEATIKSVFVEQVGMDRITMTAPLINQAQNIAFLVFGKNKAEAVYRVLEDTEGETAMYPARLIKSNKKKVVWYLDTAAASKL